MVKIKTLVLICGMIISGQASADENKTVTTQEFVESVVAVPGKVSNHLKNEWADIKEYQKASWQSGKEQTAKNIDTIKKFFGSLTNKKNNEE